MVVQCSKRWQQQVPEFENREVEAGVWQGLSMAVAREVGVQLRSAQWAATVARESDHGRQEVGPWVHSPYPVDA